MKKLYSSPEMDIRLYADLTGSVLTASTPEQPSSGSGGLTDGDDYDIFK